jgi:predicted RNA-binding Zn ribbon-like protein
MRTLETLQLTGGRLVFDFINTVNTRLPSPEFDYLKTYEDFISWSEKVKSLSKKRLQSIRHQAMIKPKLTSATFRDVIDVRENLYQLFAAIAQGRVPEASVTETFNKTLSRTFQEINLIFERSGVEVNFNSEDSSLYEPLSVTVKSAYDVLTNENFERIRECPRCGWLFLDTSKNGKRRWCDMKVCGSREKALEYYHRKAKAS